MKIKKNLLFIMLLATGIFNIFASEEDSSYGISNLFVDEEASSYSSYRRLKIRWDYVRGGRLVQIIDCDSNKVVNSIKIGDNDREIISKDSKKLIVILGHSSGSFMTGCCPVQIIDPYSGKLFRTINVVTKTADGGRSPIGNILTSYDGKKLIISLSNAIQIIDIDSGNLLKTIETLCIRDILISKDDKKLIIKASESVEIIDIDSGELLGSIELRGYDHKSEKGEWIRGFLISNDGTKLIIYSDCTVKIVDISSNELLETRLEHYSSNNRISHSGYSRGAFNYDIRDIIISSDDKKLIVNLDTVVEIIDIDTGKLLKSLVCQEKDKNGNSYGSRYRIYYMSISNNILKMDTQILKPIHEFDLDELDFVDADELDLIQESDLDEDFQMVNK